MNQKKKTDIYIFILGLLFFLIGFSGCTGAESDLYIRPPGIVDGKILDSSNQAVNKATVRLENMVANSEAVLSDLSGQFSINQVTPGIYDLVAEKKMDGINYMARRRHITITSQSAINREIQIRPSGRIAGSVVLEGQSAHDGVRVDLVGTGKYVITGADGKFEFTDVAYTWRDDATGLWYPYEISFLKDGYAIRRIYDVLLEAGGFTHVDPVTLENLDPTTVASVSLKVELDARSGSSGAKIRILGTTIPDIEIFSDHADEKSVKFENVPVGAYMLEVSHEDYFKKLVSFTVLAGQPTLDLGTVSLENTERFSQSAVEMCLSPGSHQIAYGRYEPFNSKNHLEIFLMDTVSSAYDTRISKNARVAEGRGMTWSYDGKLLVYVENNPANSDARFRMNLISSSGGEIRPLGSYFKDVAQPAFSPFDMKLVWQQHELNGDIRYALLQNPSTGYTLGTQTIVIPAKNDQVSTNQFTTLELGYSERVLFCKTGNGCSTVPLNASSDQTLVYQLPSGLSPHSATYAPGYEFIAYCISDSSDTGIWIANVDGTNPFKVSTVIGRSLQISSDGKWIYFIDTRPAWNRRISRMIIPAALKAQFH